MEYLLVFFAGVASTLVFRHFRTVAAQPAGPPPLLRLQELAAPLAAVGDASAHPRDLQGNTTFTEAVSLLASDGVPLNVVVDYASGANFMLAAAAWAALAERADRADAASGLVRQFQHLSPWPAFYALRLFATLEDRPPLGLLVLQVREYWIEHPLIASMLAEHFEERAARGDQPSFGDAIAAADAVQVTTAETLLRRIEHPTGRALLDALTAWRRGSIDRKYLETVGRFIEDSADRRLVLEHDGIREGLTRAEACITQPPYRSVIVVGEPRSGKTSFLLALASRATAKGWTIFEAGASEVTAGQQYIGQLEERLQRITSELAADKRVLWYVPDFLLFASSGRHQFQTASVLDQVLPAIATGKLVLLSEATAAGFTALSQNRPSLRGSLEVVRVPSMSDADSDRFLQRFAAHLSETTQLQIAPDVLDTVTHVARHYLGAAQMPGAGIDLLKRTAQRVAANGGSTIQRGDVLDVLSQLTGMPSLVLDTRERLDLSVLRRFFTSRVIGQDEAVSAVVDRIAMLKAGLIDPGKPVAVFLFAGPTGTGKTELAKTLAEFLFGSTERLIRLDMSEFQTAESTRKILGDADQHTDVQSLAHRVRKQPFAVLLLDEFEKAHPNSWDLFLQVFDDGRLTDATGHTVDFRHCLIILTSNLGAKIPQGPGLGFGTAAGFSQDQVVKTVHQTFRPEFVNRLDAIIVFRQLSRELMRGILMKELAGVLDRRGLRDREWAVEWESSALEFLLDRGFSPTMGARPLKRAIDRHLLAPLAATLVEHRFPEGDQFLFVRSDGRQLEVEFVDPDAPDIPSSQALHLPGAAPTLAQMIVQPAGTAEERSAVSAELLRIEARVTDAAWQELEASIAFAMQQPGFWELPARFSVLARYALADRVKAALETARGLEARLRRSATHGKPSREIVSRLASQLYVIEHGIEDARSDQPVEVVLATQPVLEASEDPAAAAAWCARLGDMYRRWASRRHMHVEEVEGGAMPLAIIGGFGAARILTGEAGLHLLEYTGARDQSARAVARVRLAPTPDDLPDDPAGRRARLVAALDQAPAPTAVVRRYRLDGAPLIRDVAHGWRTGRPEIVMDGHFDLLADLLSRH